MLRGKTRAGLQVGQHACVESFGQLHTAVEVACIARYAADHEQRSTRLGQQRRDSRNGIRRRIAGDRGWKAIKRRLRDMLRRLFLDRRVEVDEHGTTRRRGRDAIGAHHRFERGRDRRRLIVPLRVAADQCTEIARGVDPVDPRTALHRIHRTDTAQYENGNAIAPCVEDRHGRVHQADVGVQRNRHRPSRHPGIAVREGDGVLFMHA